MSNETGAQLSELRELAQQNIGQLNRAAAGCIALVRKTLDAAEANVAAFCDHAGKLAQAASPAECVKLHTEYLRTSLVALQKQTMGMVPADGEAAE